jgi:hypothetical protein
MLCEKHVGENASIFLENQIEDKESTVYFEKANMQKFDFRKNESIFTQK